MKRVCHPGWAAQWVRASSRYTKVEGSIPSQGMCKNQPRMFQWVEQVSASLSLSSPPSLKTSKKGACPAVPGSPGSPPPVHFCPLRKVWGWRAKRDLLSSTLKFRNASPRRTPSSWGRGPPAASCRARRGSDPHPQPPLGGTEGPAASKFSQSLDTPGQVSVWLRAAPAELRLRVPMDGAPFLPCAPRTLAGVAWQSGVLTLPDGPCPPGTPQRGALTARPQPLRPGGSRATCMSRTAQCAAGDPRREWAPGSSIGGGPGGRWRRRVIYGTRLMRAFPRMENVPSISVISMPACGWNFLTFNGERSGCPSSPYTRFRVGLGISGSKDAFGRRLPESPPPPFTLDGFQQIWYLCLL